MNYKYFYSILLSLAAMTANAAQLENGKVYVFTNTGRTPEHAMTVSSSGTNAVTSPFSDSAPKSDLKQQWYVSGSDEDGYTFRNLQTGGYLTYNPTTSGIWSVLLVPEPTPTGMAFNLATESDGVAIYPHDKTYNSGSYICAHRDASSNVVTWRALNSDASIWHPQILDYTDAEIKRLTDRIDRNMSVITKAAEYEAYLDNLFTDKACWQLKDGITAGNLASNADFNALTPELQAMVKKIAAGDWTETNSYNGTNTVWDDAYARKYRLQLYEPFSEGSRAASMAGIQAYTNMNNPTGLLGDKDDIIYIMVNDDLAPGTTLYVQEVPDDQMYNSATDGTMLHKGLNVIVCNHDNSHFFIYYTATTVEQPTGASRFQPIAGRELANFSPVKIHIEGGRINGFFNYIGDDLYTPDTQKDFDYTVQRATHPMYDFIGKYVILHLHLFDTPSLPGGNNERCVKTAMFTDKRSGPDVETDPVKIMKAWDRMCFAERILMGILSDEDIEDEYNLGYYETIVNQGYSKEMNGVVYDADPGYHYNDYFNNRMMGISQQGTLYMNATSWRTAYNVSTIEPILTNFCSGSIWGPAHEYGHMNQGPMNMAGTTEESNNIFSNVATYYVGKVTSRSDYISNQLKVYLGGGQFLQNGTWGTTRMFWQLWIYYHATGHNKKFYPRLYELLRKYPLRHTTVAGGNNNELYDQLQFAKMCCIAAEEDLTNFFTAWGFFVPLDGYFISDYHEYNAVLSQEDIDAVKADIASLNFPENNAIILIDDRPGSERASFDGFPKANAGEFGGLKDFEKGTEKSPTGSFSFIVDNNTNQVTVSADGGNPGAGYLIWDADGNLLAFANSNSFTVNSDVARQLVEGTARVSAVGADNKTAEVVNTLRDGDVDAKKTMLSNAIKSFDELLKYVDPTETKVGYFHASTKSIIEAFSNEAHQILDNSDAESEEVTKVILDIFEAYESLKTDPTLTIQLEDGAAYRINNLAEPSFNIFSNDNYIGPNNNNPSSYAAQWIVENDSAETYTFKSFDSFKYIAPEEIITGNVPLKENPSSLQLLFGESHPGIFAISEAGNSNRVLYKASNDITVGTLSNGNHAYWMLTKVHSAKFVELRTELASLNKKAEDLYMDPAGYNNFDLWLEFYYKYDDALSIFKDTQVSDETLEETVTDLRNFLASYESTIHNSILVTAEIGVVNDGIDNMSSSRNRQVFQPANTFEKIISLSLMEDGKAVPAELDVNNIAVSIKPVARHTWSTLRVSSDEEIDSAYESAFAGVESKTDLVSQYYTVGGAEFVDGFYMEDKTSARLEPSDEPGTYNLVLNVPCSGLYELTIDYVYEEYAIFTADSQVPVFTVEIYPNLFRTFGNNQGVNIEGYTFNVEEGVHDPTIVFPVDFFEGADTRKCNIYLPGTYFISGLSASIADSAYPDAPAGNGARRAAAIVNADASLNSLTLMLQKPQDESNNLLKLNLSKNGASASYSIYLSTGNNPTVETLTEGIAADDESETYYLDLQGRRISRPGHGIYIRIQNGKASKVIL